MYEPHLVGYEHHAEERPPGEGISILDELDKIAPLKSFDAFPKVSDPPQSSRIPLSAPQSRGGR